MTWKTITCRKFQKCSEFRLVRRADLIHLLSGTSVSIQSSDLLNDMQSLFSALNLRLGHQSQLFFHNIFYKAVSYARLSLRYFDQDAAFQKYGNFPCLSQFFLKEICMQIRDGYVFNLYKQDRGLVITVFTIRIYNFFTSLLWKFNLRENT